MVRGDKLVNGMSYRTVRAGEWYGIERQCDNLFQIKHGIYSEQDNFIASCYNSVTDSRRFFILRRILQFNVINPESKGIYAILVTVQSQR